MGLFRRQPTTGTITPMNGAVAPSMRHAGNRQRTRTHQRNQANTHTHTKLGQRRPHGGVLPTPRAPDARERDNLQTRPKPVQRLNLKSEVPGDWTSVASALPWCSPPPPVFHLLLLLLFLSVRSSSADPRRRRRRQPRCRCRPFVYAMSFWLSNYPVRRRPLHNPLRLGEPAPNAWRTNPTPASLFRNQR